MWSAHTRYVAPSLFAAPRHSGAMPNGTPHFTGARRGGSTLGELLKIHDDILPV